VFIKWPSLLAGHCKIGKLGWSSLYTRRETGENALTTVACLSLASLEKRMQTALEKHAVRSLNQSFKVFSMIFVPAVPLQTKFCQLQETIQLGTSWKALGSACSSQVHVCVSGVKSQPFTIVVGLWQGCLLSCFFHWDILVICLTVIIIIIIHAFIKHRNPTCRSKALNNDVTKVTCKANSNYVKIH